MTFALIPDRMDEELTKEDGLTPIPDGTWYVAAEPELPISYRFPVGTLAAYEWLTADALLDGIDLATFHVTLQEGSDGPAFVLRFGLLNQAQARIRFPLDAVDQSRWQTGREAAYLKPMCLGDIVDLARVDRMTVCVAGKGENPVRFCLTPFTASTDEPERLTDPVLPQGTLCDSMGQSRIRDWRGKTTSNDQLTARLRSQAADVGHGSRPSGFSTWGGCADLTFAWTGYFGKIHDGRRWWLVDPDGHAFWSMGVDCVRPRIESYVSGLEAAYEWLPTDDAEFAEFLTTRQAGGRETKFMDFLGANLKRAFGKDWRFRWPELALGLLREFGFNTVANWSDWEIARNRVPYVRPLGLGAFGKVPKAFRDLCDVFDPRFAEACTEYARQLVDTRDDPALIGYFLMNEPTWGFAAMTPAEGMLFNCPEGACRRALADWLGEKYPDAAALSAAWEVETSFEELAAGVWTAAVSGERAQADLAAFSSMMVERLFQGMSESCKAVDPNHLNLGARYFTIPPEWALAGMRHFDVFSINAYKDEFPSDLITELHDAVGVPVMVGEWHFGALDVGLPGGSLRRVANQRARGDAYRVYAEGALAHPACVGIHYFTLYDESPMGRFDGENWNIGFLDVCHRPYEPLVKAARLTHEQMYRIARGDQAPCRIQAEHLPMNVL